MNRKLMTAALALALGLAWTASPAMAQSTTEKMKDKGFDPGPIDGRMGPRTKTALRDYQKKEGLNATGRWDDETANRLGGRMSRATTTPATAGTEPATGAVSASPAAPATGEEKAPPAKRNAP